MACLVGTWRFCQSGIEAASALLRDGCSALDAAQTAVHIVELDTTVTSAGHGGLPDASGSLQLDAALMTGCGRTGAVMALENHKAAVPVARAVLENSIHVQIVGKGAENFAEKHGIPPEVDPDNLLTEHAHRRLSEWRENGAASPLVDTRKHSDTVGVIARDNAGHIAAGVATSGMEFKTPGRVGDSPIVGAGIFAENGAGAAVATGDGDRMVRHCISVRVVDLMGAGMKPKAACVTVIKRVVQSDPVCQAAVVAMSPDGTIGAASTHDGFFVVTWNRDQKEYDRKVTITKPRDSNGTGIRTVRVDGNSREHWVHSCV